MMPLKLQNVNSWNGQVCKLLCIGKGSILVRECIDTLSANHQQQSYLFSKPCTTKFHLLPQKSDGEDDSKIGLSIMGPCCTPHRLVIANIPNPSVVKYNWNSTVKSFNQ